MNGFNLSSWCFSRYSRALFSNREIYSLSARLYRYDTISREDLEKLLYDVLSESKVKKRMLETGEYADEAKKLESRGIKEERRLEKLIRKKMESAAEPPPSDITAELLKKYGRLGGHLDLGGVKTEKDIIAPLGEYLKKQFLEAEREKTNALRKLSAEKKVKIGEHKRREFGIKAALIKSAIENKRGAPLPLDTEKVTDKRSYSDFLRQAKAAFDKSASAETG